MTSIDLDDYTLEEESEASPPMSIFQHLYRSSPAAAIARPLSARLPATTMTDDDELGPRFKDQARPDLLQPATVPDAIEEQVEEEVQEEEQVREEHLVDTEIPMVSALWVTDSQIRLEDQDQLKLERQQFELERQQLELERQQRQQLEEQLEQQRQVLEQLLGVANQPPQPPPPPATTNEQQQQQEPTTVAENGGSGSKKRWIGRTIVAAIVVCFLAGGGAAAFVGICGTSGNCRDSSRSSSIRSYINNSTLTGRSLQYPSNATAEERALQWLIDVDRGTSESNMIALRQRYALATIWFQTPTGFGDAGWATEITECDWQGVDCDDAGRLVTLLNLIGNDIEGHIPADLGLLTALTSLRLDHNKLTGTIPSSIASLTALTFLGLGVNELEGTIPTTIGSLTDLIYLYLYNNGLTGTMPFCNSISNQSFGFLVADCEKVSCPCCTHCCPTSRDGIPDFVLC